MENVNARKVISNDGTAIAYDRKGAGPAVILVDGAFCYRAFGPAEPLAGFLAQHFTVFTYDRRGRGESGDTPPYAIKREVEDLEALIHAAGEPAFVFGTSSGGALALEAAASGLDIHRLAVYEPPFMIDDRQPRPAEDLVMQLAQRTAEGRRGEAAEYFLTRAIGLPAEAAAQMRQAPMWPAMEAVAPTLVYDAAIMAANRWLPGDQLASIRVPTLVIDGGASPAWAGDASRALVDLIPNAQRLTLPGQTHEVAPDALAPVLTAFFLSFVQGVKPTFEILQGD